MSFIKKVLQAIVILSVFLKKSPSFGLNLLNEKISEETGTEADTF
jgi:hypothetical protein